MAAKKRPAATAGMPPAAAAAGTASAGFSAPPADGGLSIDRLAQAFAAMMGTAEAPPAADLVQVDASADLDADQHGLEDVAEVEVDGGRVTPQAILEACLFVGLPGGRPLDSRRVAGLMRGMRPDEVDSLADDLARRYRAENRPYEVVSRDGGWVMRLRPEFARFGSVLEARARLVRLDAEALDVLALVGWHQPVPRDRLVELGCDARPATLRLLVRRGLLELRRPSDGGEPTYHTTPRFLEVFGLASLADLPDPTAPPG
jgi:chromosome segregation and condensation protein ScpB